MKIKAINNCPYRDFAEPPTFKVKFKNTSEFEALCAVLHLAAAGIRGERAFGFIAGDEDAAKLIENFAVKLAENGGL